MDKLVKVTWLDSAMWGGDWLGVEHLGEYKLALCVSVGWIIGETGDMLLLCQSTSEKFRANLIGIPRACIKSRKEVKWRKTVTT